MSDLKTEIINSIIKIEGGYVNDPSDSGGATNFGITEKVARQNGYTGDMRDLPIEFAFNVYVEQFWNRLQLPTIQDLSEMLAEEIADTGVNMGINRAAIFLQRSLNVLNNQEKYYPDLVVDGQLGQKTIRALSEYLAHRETEGEIVLVKMLNSLQGAFYVELSERRVKDEKFIYGWFVNRVKIV